MLDREEEIFEAALKAFRDNFAGMPVHIDTLDQHGGLGPDSAFDRLLRLTFGENQIQYHVEIKNILLHAHVGLLIHHKKTVLGKLLLVANYVNDILARELKENRIDFIDAAGNVFINQFPLYVEIKGNKQNNKYLSAPPGQAFRPTGLKVIFALLCEPQIINEGYRTIAQTADVSIGYIGWLITDLKRLGFLLDKGKRKYKLVNKQRLLNRFVEEYPNRLRRQLLFGNFKGEMDWQQKNDLDYVLWGGEVAAAKMTNYLKPQTLTVYIKPVALKDFLLNNRLKRDPEGNIEILKMFWTFNEPAIRRGWVHPILTYADLMATGQQRNIEAAKVLYEQDVARFIRED